MSQPKGFERERELVNLFHDAGFGVTRVPKSGGGTKRELPDILAGSVKQGEIYAIEAKARKNGYIYLSGKEVESLVYFARRFGANPKIGVRYDYEDWYFFHPADLHITRGGNFRITREAAIENGQSLTDLTNTNKEPDRVIPEMIRAVDSGLVSADEAIELLNI